MPQFPTWLRYGIPGTCFCLGTWQVYRLQWKQDLIRELEHGLSLRSIKLEALPNDLEAIRFRRLKLYGDPLLGDSPPIFVGPRGARDVDAEFAMQFVVPFRLRDGTRVLIDYGKVPLGREAEIVIPTNEPFVEVMLDRPEKKSMGMRWNEPEKGKWLYKDVDAMAKTQNTEPILFRRIRRKLDTKEIPISLPPKVELSNRHFEYILTWYTMAAATYLFGFLKK